MYDFNRRTILVTGASGEIGGATVRQLVAANADVIASGRSQRALDALASDTGCRTLAFDLSSEDEIRTALEGLDLWGAVNCGGFGGEIATPMDTDITIFDKVITINARGALLVTKYASQSMVRLGKGGAIVNVSSSGGSGGPAWAHFVRLIKGSARQHHTRFCARTRALRHPGQQCESDSSHDPNFLRTLEPTRGRRAFPRTNAAGPLGYRG